MSKFKPIPYVEVEHDTLAVAKPAPEIPVVCMTAKLQLQEMQAYKKMGVVDMIPKPFGPMPLADIVKQIWVRENG